MEKAQVRIIAGTLRGRKLHCMVHPGLRPTPDRVRGALFSILGNAIPGRPFIDIFAGTGVVGIEALSRGASNCTLIERDIRLAGQIEEQLRQFQMAEVGRVLKADVYRWVDRWQPANEPINVFVSPPFPDLDERLDEFVKLVASLQTRLPYASVLTVQVEDEFDPAVLPDAERWEARKYGRNLLLIWEPPDPVIS